VGFPAGGLKALVMLEITEAYPNAAAGGGLGARKSPARGGVGLWWGGS